MIRRVSTFAAVLFAAAMILCVPTGTRLVTVAAAQQEKEIELRELPEQVPQAPVSRLPEILGTQLSGFSWAPPAITRTSR
jgi:hypothetical protein